VRHTSTAILDDGRRVVRAGCRFVELTPAAAALVEEYVANHPASAST